MSDAVTPFTIDIPQSELDNLKARIANTRWPEAETVSDWSQGVPLAYAKELADYWVKEYDWRRWEATLNSWPQFTTQIDDVDIHFLHIRSKREDALPMVISHGWPGSVVEFHKIIEPLTNPDDDSPAFHLVLPSLPGYDFSGKPAAPGTTVEQIGRMWGKLMARLGYDSYVAQGGDWGAIITQSIAQTETVHCKAIHTNMPICPPDEEGMQDMTDLEVSALEGMAHYAEKDSGYSKIQSTRPQTIGYALADSPVGQMTWIIDKFWSWTDSGEGDDQHPENVLTRDELLDNVMMFWLNNAGASSARLYWESFNTTNMDKVDMPTGASIFPKEIFRASRRWAEKRFTNIIHWNHLDKGGHFAALEQPETFVTELRNCFSQLQI